MYKLARLAQLVEAEVSGNPELIICRARSFETAEEGDITYASSSRYLDRLHLTKASAVIANNFIHDTDKSLLQVSNPKLAFAKVLKFLSSKPFQARGVSSLASLGVNCQISSQVSVAPFVHVGDEVTIEGQVTIESGCSIGNGCRISEGTILNPNVTLYPGVTIGRHVILHSGCVVGADGFGYVSDSEGHLKIEQTGTVIIEDNVDIGANSCIDRGTFGATVVGMGSKLDNLVHVGHNCQIGHHTIIVGCVGISGSVQIGDHCLIAGQAGISHHVKIGDNVTIMQKTAVTKNVPSGSVVSGLHCRDHREQLRLEALIQKLPEHYQDWRNLKKQLESLVNEKAETEGNEDV